MNNTVIISNNNEKYTFEKLNNIRETIENMNKYNQLEVLRILSKHKNITINENKYGNHINLSELENGIIDELIMYIKYVNIQENDLDNIEKQKEEYKNIFFLQDK
jgi:hypothetical protein